MRLRTVKAVRKDTMATIRATRATTATTKAVRAISEASRMEWSFSNRTIRISRRAPERQSIALRQDPHLEKVTELSDDE